MDNGYPYVGFHFKAVFEGIGDADKEARFQEVTGLTAKLETEEITEGGENRFKHRLPTRSSFSEITLKRALYLDSAVSDWALKAIEGLNYAELEPVDVSIMLLNEEHKALTSWSVVNAYPTQLQISDLKAEDNGLMVETLTLTYQFFRRIK